LRGETAEQGDKQQQPAGDQPQQPLQGTTVEQDERDSSSDGHAYERVLIGRW
jgi:hypothetical protein